MTLPRLVQGLLLLSVLVPARARAQMMAAGDLPGHDVYHQQCGSGSASDGSAAAQAIAQYCRTYAQIDSKYHAMERIGDVSGGYSPSQASQMMAIHSWLRANAPGLFKSAQDSLKSAIDNYSQGDVGTQEPSKDTLQKAYDDMDKDHQQLRAAVGEHNLASYKSAANSSTPDLYPPWQSMTYEPSAAEIAAGQAKDALKSGDLSSARDAANQALSSDPNRLDAVMTRGAASLGLKDYAGALSDGQKALGLAPGNQTAKGIVEYAEQAMGHVGHAPTAQNPFGAGQGAGFARGAGRDSTSYGAAMIPRADWASGSRAEKLAREAAAKLGLGDAQAALKTANAAIAADPENPAGYSTLAMILNQQGRYREAVDAATKALQFSPNDLRALDARAFAYNKMGLAQKALVDADSALRINPRDAYAHLNRALAYDHLGPEYRAQALREMKLAAGLNPKFKSDLQAMIERYGTDDESQFAPGLASRLADGAAGLMRGAAGKARSLVSWLGLLLGLPLLALAAYGLRDGYTRRPKPSTWRKNWTTPLRWALGAGAPPAPGSPQGRIGGHYSVVREIGRGGMGLVYEAIDEALQRKVAIKKMREEIRDSRRDRERFMQEARLVASLKHPNVVEIHAILEDGGEVYLILEHVDGAPLDKLLDERRVLPLAEAKRLVRDVASGLAFAHERRVVHRDLKPANILLTKDGRAKVADFGIARVARDTVSKLSRTEAWGTPAYMAPEQELGQVSKESDIYSLGVLLYETLTGDVPFRGPSFLDQKRARLYRRASEVNRALPPAIDEVIDRALDPDPNARFRSALDLAAALDAIGTKTPV